MKLIHKILAIILNAIASRASKLLRNGKHKVTRRIAGRVVLWCGAWSNYHEKRL